MPIRFKALKVRCPIQLITTATLAAVMSNCAPNPYLPIVSPQHVVSTPASPRVESRASNPEKSQRETTATSHSNRVEYSDTSSSSDSQYDDISMRLEEQERYQRERDEREEEYRARAEERERERERRRRDREHEHERCEAVRKAEFLKQNKSQLQEALKKKFGR